MRPTGLQFGAIPPTALHLCVDMQRIFSEATPWHVEWMPRTVPVIEPIVEHRPDRTVFTRFIPAQKPGDGPGAWARYSEKWAEMTLAHLDPALLELVPELQKYAQRAHIVDKTIYSPWRGGKLQGLLEEHQTDTLIVTGGETDICVLASVIGAIDRGYRVVVVKDAVCSSQDATHDAMMTLFSRRYSEQVELAESGEVLENWKL